jgi:hypothetical protein
MLPLLPLSLGTVSAYSMKSHRATQKEFDKMLQHAVVEIPGTQRLVGGTVHSRGTVVKHSDKYKARVLTGIELRNQNDWDEVIDDLD